MTAPTLNRTGDDFDGEFARIVDRIRTAQAALLDGRGPFDDDPVPVEANRAFRRRRFSDDRQVSKREAIRLSAGHQRHRKTEREWF